MPKKTSRTKAAATKKAPARRTPAAAKPKTSAQELQRLVSQMVVERQHHIDSIAEIDQTFKEFGIASAGAASARGGKRGKVKGKGKSATGEAAATKPAKAPAKKGGRKAGKKAAAPKAAKAPKAPKAAKAPKKAKSRKGVKSGKFEITGDELIIRFLQSTGGASTEEIRKHWETSGRRGKAENNLTNLVKSGKIKRTKMTGKPGSTYQVSA